MNYLKDIRIEQAKRLLVDTDEKIISISHRVGYENEKHFMKIFRNECGISPSEYRKSIRIGNE
ncbi:two-component response regulator yesN [Lachnospiraceae bacterium KM106-2]|nr:two-component response regulator yesN [Lachnospiraceae bacterium KM106-2]